MSHLTTLFVTGTDTDVGKTYVGALIAATLRQQGHRVGIYKPVASGCRVVDGQRVADDALALWQAAGRPQTLQQVCPQQFLLAVSPPASAAAEGKQVDRELLIRGAERWTTGFDVRLIEGAGGLFSPLAEGLLNIDFLGSFADARPLIVAANRLGVIHQVLATCAGAAQRGVQPAGVILCQTTERADESVVTNRSELERYCDVPILAAVGYGATRWDDASTLEALFGKP